MRNNKVIAVCGKGGVGKTALTAMIARELRKRKDAGRLLVVDADPALGLLYALNIDTDKTIGGVRDKVLEAAESGNAGSQAEVANELDYLITSSLKEEDGYAFIAMGHMDAKGCFCSVNKLLRDALEELDLHARLFQIIDGAVKKAEALHRAAAHTDHCLLALKRLEGLERTLSVIKVSR